MSAADRTLLAVLSLPRDAPSGEAGGQTPDRTSAQDEHVVDDESKRIQPCRPHGTQRTHGPGELFHHDKGDRDDDAIPPRAPDWSDAARQEPPGEQRAEDQQPLANQLTPSSGA